MKQALMGLFQALETQTTFVAQIAADVAALKLVLFSLDGRARPLFEQQVALTSGTFQAVLEAHRREIETLRQIVSRLPTQKPN